jgi:hypothetical protein
MSSLAHHHHRRHDDDTVFLGMDVHKDQISVGSATPVMKSWMSRRSSTTRSRSAA